MPDEDPVRVENVCAKLKFRNFLDNLETVKFSAYADYLQVSDKEVVAIAGTVPFHSGHIIVLGAL